MWGKGEIGSEGDRKRSPKATEISRTDSTSHTFVREHQETLSLFGHVGIRIKFAQYPVINTPSAHAGLRKWEMRWLPPRLPDRPKGGVAEDEEDMGWVVR